MYIEDKKLVRNKIIFGILYIAVSLLIFYCIFQAVLNYKEFVKDPTNIQEVNFMYKEIEPLRSDLVKTGWEMVSYEFLLFGKKEMEITKGFEKRIVTFNVRDLVIFSLLIVALVELAYLLILRTSDRIDISRVFIYIYDIVLFLITIAILVTAIYFFIHHTQTFEYRDLDKDETLILTKIVNNEKIYSNGEKQFNAKGEIVSSNNEAIKEVLQLPNHNKMINSLSDLEEEMPYKYKTNLEEARSIVNYYEEQGYNFLTQDADWRTIDYKMYNNIGEIVRFIITETNTIVFEQAGRITIDEISR